MSTLFTTKIARQQQWLVRLQTALRTQGTEAAGRLALEALGEGVEHVAVINLAASAHFGEGRFSEALGLLNRARVSAPDNPQLLNSIGLCLRSLSRLDEALQTFNQAIAISPSMAPAHFNRGIVLEDLKYINEARSAFQQALALDPNEVDAAASIAWLDAQAGDTASARMNAERALMRSPLHVMARLALTSADLQAGNLGSANGRLAALESEPQVEAEDRAVMLGLLGDLRDREGRTAEAFSAYEASNAVQRAIYAARYEAAGSMSALDHVRRNNAWFETADPGRWRDEAITQPGPTDPKVHVFLVGFPRSGTTLLENVLATHSQVATLEERNCLEQAVATYMTSDSGLERLASIGPAELARERESYWSKVRQFGVEPNGKVFIDKLPLASIALPLIAKLFPKARILFARRDPRDVVLSCFRRGFGMNAAMYQLLTLEGAAAYFDAVMRLSDCYRQILPLEQHIVRHESLLEDFEATVRAACAFIGLAWDEGMLDFAASARSRGIATPSASQVVRGINREGEGVWRRYREQMAPVLPVLEPWAIGFGYEQ